MPKKYLYADEITEDAINSAVIAHPEFASMTEDQLREFLEMTNPELLRIVDETVACHNITIREV